MVVSHLRGKILCCRIRRMADASLLKNRKCFQRQLYCYLQMAPIVFQV